jgi:hypothetical protein
MTEIVLGASAGGDRGWPSAGRDERAARPMLRRVLPYFDPYRQASAAVADGNCRLRRSEARGLRPAGSAGLPRPPRGRVVELDRKQHAAAGRKTWAPLAAITHRRRSCHSTVRVQSRNAALNNHAAVVMHGRLSTRPRSPTTGRGRASGSSIGLDERRPDTC